MARKIGDKGSPRWGGVDPGKEGFLVVYDGRGPVQADPIPYLGNEVNVALLLQLLRGWRFRHNVVLALVEHQQPFGREGVSSIWTSAEAFGALKACLTAVGVPFALRRPHEWKPAVGIPVVGAPKGLPRLPKKPRAGTREALVRWKVAHAAISEKRRGLLSHRRTKLKDLAVARAQQLAPAYDFRATIKSLKPHNGKAEAFLLSVLAQRAWNGR